MTGTPLRRVGNRWERFWFEEVPPELYALLRIALGAIGVAGVLSLTPVSMYWSVDGIAPVPGGGMGLRGTVSSLGVSALAGWALFMALLASFGAMTVGWRSRVVVPICFVASMVQARWNSLPLSSAHQALIAFLFCLMWVDTGATWSLDRWLTLRRSPAPPAPDRQPIWALRLLRYQIALIYLGSGVSKLLDPAWRDGSAVHYVVNLNVFHRFPYVIPPQMDWLLVSATYVTLLWELAFALLLFHRWSRRVALALGVMMHLGMWALLELGPFSWVMLAGYLAFLDPHAVSRDLAARLPRYGASRMPVIRSCSRIASAASSGVRRTVSMRISGFSGGS